MTELVKYVASQVPLAIEDYPEFFIISDQLLKAHRAFLKGLKDSPSVSKEFYDAKLADGQRAGELVLDARRAFGLALKEIERKYIPPPVGSREGTDWNLPVQIKTLPPGLTKKESHLAQTIAMHPDVVEMVKARSVQKGEIPTATEVYKEIKKQERQEMHQAKHVQPFPEGKYAAGLADLESVKARRERARKAAETR